MKTAVYTIWGDILLYLIIFITAVILGILIGRIKGKSLDVFEVRLEKTWLIIIVFAFQTAVRILGIKGMAFPKEINWLINGSVFALILLCLWFNRRYIGLWVIGFGAFLNALVMTANEGKMPVDIKLVENMGSIDYINIIKEGFDSKHSILTENTRMDFLADIIYIPGFLGLGMPVVSIGDVIIAIGVFVFVLNIFAKHSK